MRHPTDSAALIIYNRPDSHTGFRAIADLLGHCVNEVGEVLTCFVFRTISRGV
jgi:hypothetical protein